MRRHDAIRTYRRFHKKEPDKITEIDFPTPKTLVCLGRAVAVEYESKKKFVGQKRKTNVFRHEIGKGVMIYTDETGKWLFVSGGRFHVTDWLRG